MRNKTRQALVLSMVVFLIIIMLGGDVGRVLFSLLSTPKDYIGSINTDYIHYADYKDYIEKFSPNSTQPLSDEEQARLKEFAWHQLISDRLYAQEASKLDMVVGSDEVVDLVQGNHIDPMILDAFKDPKSGQFDKQLLLDRLGNFTQAEQELWLRFEQSLASNRLKHKLNKLMEQSWFKTTLEEEYATERSKEVCDVDYVYIPFHLIDDDVCMPSQADLEQYIDSHKEAYVAKDCKFIQYVTFPIMPDAQDHQQFQETLSRLAKEFAGVKDAYMFAKQHTDGLLSKIKISGSIEQLPKDLIALKHKFKQGVVLGPIVRSGVHYLYKITDIAKQQGVVQYKMAVIEKKVVVGQDTYNKCYSQALHFATQAKSFNAFKTLASSQHIPIQREEVYPWSAGIGSYSGARAVVRWLYTKAAMHKVSEVFDLGDAYMVAVLVDQTKQGERLPLSAVYNEVWYKVINQEKAKLILDKLKQISWRTLQDVATQYGEHIVVKHIDSLKHDYNEAKDLFQANNFIGTCFGLKVGDISKPIVDQHGIFIAQIKAKYVMEKPAEDLNVQQMDKFMQGAYILKAMQENAKIKDERYFFQ